ncbi:MAG: LysE family translocator [Ornithinimicrobium sp.]
MLAPGPDMAFIVAAGAAGGRRAATLAALGVTLGVTVYVIVTVAGLGVLLARSPTALDVIRVVGALYLVYLCFDTVRAAGGEHAEAPSGGRVFRRGLIVNLTNPKIALFFIAFLPQFLGKAEAEPALQLLMLGLTLQICGLLIDLALGYGAGAMRDRVLSKPTARLSLDLMAAAVYGGLSAYLIYEAIAQ